MSPTLPLLTLLVCLASSDIIKAPSMPSGFSGSQTGIGSWYQANTGRDSTNGHSWCGYPYTDNDPLFAPSLATMGGAASGSAWTAATKQYCGLEAKVTDTKTGKTSLMYIGDSFAHPPSPGSIDIMLGAYSTLDGNPGGNKNTVIKDVQWELTGNMNTAYMAPGAPGATPGQGGGSTSSTGGGAGVSPSPSSGSGSSSSGGKLGPKSSASTLATKTRKGSGQQKTGVPGTKVGTTSSDSVNNSDSSF